MRDHVPYHAHDLFFQNFFNQSNFLLIYYTMVTASGLLFSTILGAAARRLQVQLVGKTYARSFNRVPGYALSIGAFIGGYYVIDQYVEHNKTLLERRLLVLREQRAKKAAFYEFEDQEDHRMTKKLSGRWLGLLDKYVTAYK